LPGEDQTVFAQDQRLSVVVPSQDAPDDAAARDAWARSARPTCRQIETDTDRQVPRSTANAITNGHAVPKDLRQYVAFLNACEISSDALAPWLRAWTKVRGVPKTEERRLAPKWMQPAVAALYFTTVLTAAQDRLEDDAWTMTEGQKTHLRTVVAQAREALRKANDESPEPVDGDAAPMKGFIVLDGERQLGKIPPFTSALAGIAA
jgi:hypothetical protein